MSPLTLRVRREVSVYLLVQNTIYPSTKQLLQTFGFPFIQINTVM